MTESRHSIRRRSSLLPPPPFKAVARLPYWRLDKVLIRFEDEQGGGVDLTIRDSADGVFIAGNKGSGKSSGSGATLQHALIAAKSGMLILPFKDGSEREQIEGIATVESRSDQLCVFGPGGNYRFNFTEYLSRHPDEAVRSPKHFAPLLEAIFAATIPAGEGSRDPFWVGQVARIAEAAYIIVANCGETFTMTLLLEFVRNAPLSPEEVHRGYWKETIFGRLLTAAIVNAAGTPQEKQVADAVTYWTKIFCREPDVTRGGALMGFENLAAVFSDPILKRLFEGEDSNLIPEHVVQNCGIVFVDLPIARYKTVGRVAQTIWRVLVQDAILRRNDPEDDCRPLCTIWCDEFQFHIEPTLNQFLSTCREVRGVFVGICQSIPALYAAVGGRTPEHSTQAMLSNLVCKIIHNVTDPVTCRWASEQIGNTRRWKASGSQNKSPSLFSAESGGGDGLGLGLDAEPWIRPEEFQSLATGGPLCNFQVGAVVVLGQKAIAATGRPYLEVTFIQHHASVVNRLSRRRRWSFRRLFSSALTIFVALIVSSIKP